MERKAKISMAEGICLIIAGIVILLLFGLNLESTGLQGPYLYWTFFGVLSIFLGLGLMVYTWRTLDRST